LFVGTRDGSAISGIVGDLQGYRPKAAEQQSKKRRLVTSKLDVSMSDCFEAPCAG
jgi:hypothetical protein